MLASKVQSAFGEPDNWALDRYSKPTVLKYDEVELHFFNEELGLVHAEIRADEPRAFHSQRLGLAADELLWPINLDELAAAAQARGVAVTRDVDVLDRPVLAIGYATVTYAVDTVVVSVGPVR
jgi:hypothetical protein